MPNHSSIHPANDVTDVRRASIDHHDDVVSQFEDYYRALERDRFSNAFAYGRHKIDRALDREVSRLPARARILDIGCGTGVYLRRFAGLGMVPVGLEPAPGMLEIAQRENPGLEVVSGVATELPFPDASFDAVTAIEVFRYLHEEDVNRSIREMLRVLRPGGFFFVTLVNRWALDGFFLLQRLRQLRKGVSYDRKNPHCEFTTPREVERMFRAAGASDVQTSGLLLAPLRIAYKANEKIGGRIASAVEAIDDRIHERAAWTKPFAGHLIASGHR